MQTMPKTLIEMNWNERSGMLSVVVEALRAMAEEALEQGDARLAANAVSIAYSIIGCAADRSEDHVPAAALLLEHGIQFMQAHELGGSVKNLVH
jgi:hypothetical protein